MNLDLSHKTSKYLIQGIAVYMLFVFVPNTQMSNKDALLLTVIFVLIYAVIENFFNMFILNNDPAQKQCASQCSAENNEHMESVQHSNMLGAVQANTFNVMHEQKRHQGQEQLYHQAHTLAMQEKPTMNMQERPVQEQNIISKNNNMMTKQMNETFSQPITKMYSVSQSNGTINYNYSDYNSLPANDNTFENGYSFLPPSQWFPVPANPPICIPQKECKVCGDDDPHVQFKQWVSAENYQSA